MRNNRDESTQFDNKYTSITLNYFKREHQLMSNNETAVMQYYFIEYNDPYFKPRGLLV